MKSRVTGIVLAVALFAAVAVAKKYPITAASNVPAARGEARPPAFESAIDRIIDGLAG